MLSYTLVGAISTYEKSGQEKMGGNHMRNTAYSHYNFKNNKKMSPEKNEFKPKYSSKNGIVHNNKQKYSAK